MQIFELSFKICFCFFTPGATFLASFIPGIAPELSSRLKKDKTADFTTSETPSEHLFRFMSILLTVVFFLYSLSTDFNRLP